MASKLGRNTRGVIALKFALAVPGLAVLVLGGVDLYAVQSDKARLQQIADAAALAGARELGLAVDAAGPEGRAMAYIQAQLAQWPQAPTVVPDVEVVTLEGGERALRAALDGNRLSFFGNMLPPGGWNMHAEATAASIAVTPLCVLAHGSSRDQTLNLRDSAQIRAPACLVHSNRDIEVQNVARLEASLVQAGTRATGTILPTASTDAPAIPDPFADLNLVNSRGVVPTLLDCVLGIIPKIYINGRHSLAPGVHCGGIDVRGTAQLDLQPGEHWFLAGELQVRGTAKISGDDVVLLFGDDARFSFIGQATVDFDGRRSGPLAGLVLASLRDNEDDFLIAADHVENLHGVIYIPSARLVVEGTQDIARESAWTVVVAKELQLTGSPRVFINANYGASDVPVPRGVGPDSGGSRLIE